MENPWLNYDISGGIDFHPLDKETALKFNAGKRKPVNSDYRLNGSLSPLPFHGNPNNARVVILMSNPGIDKDQTELEKTPVIQKLLDECRKHILAPENSFVWLRPELEGMTGQKWWKSRTRVLREIIGDQAFQAQTFAAEIHPYYSVKYKTVGTQFPTTAYTYSLIRDLMANDVAILIRSRAWLEAIPELATYRHLFQLKTPRSSYITPANLADGDFERLVRYYKR